MSETAREPICTTCNDTHRMIRDEMGRDPKNWPCNDVFVKRTTME